MTEEMAAGAEGSPCLGDALLVHLTLDDGTTREAYVCPSFEPDPVAMDIILAPITNTEQASE